jgi:UDP-N-acetylmuramoyl-L-alanyl-D-glutamate--2,6-diaminopimelate ligase
MKKLLKKIIPKQVLSLYHFLNVKFYRLRYGDFSRKMIVVGVTGTKGKSTAANMIWSVLSAAGMKVGLSGTANFRIGDKESLNIWHMTMPGPKVLYKELAKMAKEKCGAVVVETTSEGIKQHRHLGINYDIVVFTNLSPEHIASHGSYHNYRAAKGKLFVHLNKSRRKLFGKTILLKKTIVFGDDPEAGYFLNFPADEKLTYGFGKGNKILGRDVKATSRGVEFYVGAEKYFVPILGAFNAENALAAVAVGKALGLSYQTIAKGLANLPVLPGRMEIIESKKLFTTIVDYAHEKKSMTALLKTAREIAGKNKVIVLLGAEGGGRDKAKRPVMGEIAAKMADFVIVSNVDPYEDDPIEIIEDISSAAQRAGKKLNKNLFNVEDRREGIAKALSLAKKGDLVLITGKGAEQQIIIGGKRLPWDDRQVVREELEKIK